MQVGEPEKIIAFTVPYLIPPSGNHYKEPCKYIGRNGYMRPSFRLTPEAKAYYGAVALFARGRTVAPDTDAERRKARYSVRMDVYLGPNQRGDFDNFWKCGADALVKCGLIHSDAAIDGEESKCVVHRDQRTNPRTEYLVTRMENNATGRNTNRATIRRPVIDGQEKPRTDSLQQS